MNDTALTGSQTSRWLLPLALFVGTLLLIGATCKDYGIAWDEPPYFHASDLHVGWIRAFAENIAGGELRKSIDDQTIKAAWHWNPYNVPHPPFSRILSGGIKEIAPQFLDKFTAYRMGPALFFAVLVTVMFLWMEDLFGTSTGLFSALAVVLTPNLFGYAHIAVTDLPLASMWFLTSYCFWKGLTNWRWSLVLGVVWGLSLATKFPALLIPVPLILWAHLFRRDKYMNNVFALLFMAPIFMIGTQPYLWHQTGLRILEFLYEGMSRAYRPDANFPIYFFNQLYTSNQLPWYYSFLVIGITTPEPLLALALIGLGSIPWSKQRSATLFFMGNTAFVLLIGLLPGAVLHDGVRQMLSALPFLAGLAGAGFYVLTTSLLNLARASTRFHQIANLRAKIIAIWFLLLCFSPALDLYLCHPFQLSFYNRLVGGVRGAYERGLETTYFMEAFTPSFLQTLNERIPQNATINASFASFMLDYYQKEGRLRRDLKITNEKPSNYYVLLNRRSTLSPQERNLINGKSEPYVAVTIAGVPLVSVFAFEKRD